MKFLSLCSGIDAASVAWNPIGWEAEAFSEIEPFPSAVLAHHYPAVPNLGDMTLYHEWPDTLRPDLIVGGTPCQAFSVAGLRKGLADPRGNLTLVFLGVLERVRPRWVVWENVPGVLSDGTGAFGSFLSGLAKLGYGFAYRILDAQHFGVPQRRRRVFVVGYLGDWRRAAAVLFERESLCGHPAPGRAKGAPVANLTANGVGTCGADDNQGQAGHLIAHSLRGEGFDASEDGTGRGTPLVPVHTTGAGFWQEGFGTLRGREQDSHENLIAFSCKDHGADAGEISPTLRSMGHDGSHANAGGQVAVCFDTTQITSPENRSNPQPGDPCHPLAAGARPPALAFTIHGTDKTASVASETETAGCIRTKPPGSIENSSTTVALTTAVRRLTPRECERLQGFPDDYTLIPWRGKALDLCPDGPRYKALGNSMAVPVMRWIGERIAAADTLETL